MGKKLSQINTTQKPTTSVQLHTLQQENVNQASLLTSSLVPKMRTLAVSSRLLSKLLLMELSTLEALEETVSLLLSSPSSEFHSFSLDLMYGTSRPSLTVEESTFLIKFNPSLNYYMEELNVY